MSFFSSASKSFAVLLFGLARAAWPCDCVKVRQAGGERSAARDDTYLRERPPPCPPPPYPQEGTPRRSYLLGVTLPTTFVGSVSYVPTLHGSDVVHQSDGTASIVHKVNALYTMEAAFTMTRESVTTGSQFGAKSCNLRRNHSRLGWMGRRRNA